MPLMHRHLEQEIKLGLDRDQHLRLGADIQALLGRPDGLAQENRFYDTADLCLRAARMNLRLRRENRQVVVTVKARGSAQDGLHAHDEWEAVVDPLVWELRDEPEALLVQLAMLPEVVQALLAGRTLVEMGGFANHRQLWIEDGDHICLDRTTFPGGRIDHELEIETADPGHRRMRWQTRFAGWRLPWRPMVDSKFARYLASQVPPAHPALAIAGHAG